MDLDARLFLWLNEALSGPVATIVAGAINWLGDGLVLAVLILVPMFALDRKRFRNHAGALVLAVAAGGLVVLLTKIAVDRPRPPERFAGMGLTVHAPHGSPPDRSFPSGHTQTATGAAVYLSFVYPLAAPLLLLLAAGVGLSRVALGVHYPLDVVVGAAVGAAFSVAGYLINRRRLRRREVR